GINVENYLLSSRQLNNYRSGIELQSENDVKAARGAYFIESKIHLNPSASKNWFIIGDINQDLSSIAEIENLLNSEDAISEVVEKDIELGTENLIKIVGTVDGLQISNDKLGTSRHFSNVLFNTMRGGIFDDAYQINKNDFILFLQSTNKRVFNSYKNFINSFNEKISFYDLKKEIENQNDTELNKLLLEYLPLTFSRRHGDPSRPWNRFSIDIKDSKNHKLLSYQGNWRDLFQNWEALALSYPGYLESMIAKFLNASTADGYNPYRVTRDGFDWEAPEADMPWANIGYWGDHQIIYLLKLLELSFKHNEVNLLSYLDKKIFTYANVPYRIKSYHELLNDPHNTITFDHELNKRIITEELEVGTDARFLLNKDGSLYQVNLIEKLLVPLLSKLTNFIPGGGIWLNTQRPEWNDANNALVGYGISMVTLYYIKRYLTFCLKLFSINQTQNISISEEVGTWFKDLYCTLRDNLHLIKVGITDKDRKIILDGLGLAGERYRDKIYSNGFNQTEVSIEVSDLIDFFNVVTNYVDYTIRMNKRSDHLYHSYNLMSIKDNEEIKITHLYEMLEGQVAVLSSEFLSIEESLEVLRSLRTSKLYREDQNSYILYPDRQLPLFVQKNIISSEDFNSSKLLQELINDGNEDIIVRDFNGNYHFDGEIRNSNVLKSKLASLNDEKFGKLLEVESRKVFSIYESVFNHKAFTGRSGTFYKYEGLGSIYWHMVSKLLLAVQEVYKMAQDNNASAEQLSELNEFYYHIKDGIGVNKNPKDYGAFPTDPYSHTPSFSGVQQPGMTGQVKEDIISRFGELGIQIIDGSIYINTSLLRKKEFLLEDLDFNYYDVSGLKRSIIIKKGSLGFTYCQVPFIFTIGDSNKLTITKTNKQKLTFNELFIDQKLSNSIFKRNGEIEKVELIIKTDL
ncbi:MAG: hypothetical protein OQJ81_00005, partial [Melioribacteraceae bacterium]|nr:hypothetical protein [Melioribacteraceae bacterium]